MDTLRISDIRIIFAISLFSGLLFLLSGILYSLKGIATGYVLVVIGLIVVLSATRMRSGATADVRDGSMGVLFFGILNLISFVFILSGAQETTAPFYLGLLASITGILGGLSGFLYSKKKEDEE